MSKAEILAELPKLPRAERSEIFDRLCSLQEKDLSHAHQQLVDEALASGPARSATDADWKSALQRGLKRSRKPT